MNITSDLHAREDRPTVLSLLRTEKTQVLIVGLSKDQVLAKHKTSVPALLVVIDGTIDFVMMSNVLTLTKHDVYAIPMEEEHEVVGVNERNSFMIIKYAH
jgi:quercetin dioxygenase-like cupin family protein